MKTARFSQLVQRCGKPESYLVLMTPAKDKTLQAAIQAQRVLTVTQATKGAKADYGEVGFQEGGTRQYLVFPKSLRSFAGKKIVGINYDLLSLKELPASQRAPAPKEPRPKKTSRQTKSAGKVPDEKVIPFRAPHGVDDEDEGQEAEEKEGKKPAKKAPKEKTAKPTPSASLQEMKRLARQAMRALKAGKQVAAFELLKKMAG